MEAWGRSKGPSARETNISRTRVCWQSQGLGSKRPAQRQADGLEGERAPGPSQSTVQSPGGRRTARHSCRRHCATRFDWGRRGRDRGTQAAADHHTPGLETAGTCLSPSGGWKATIRGWWISSLGSPASCLLDGCVPLLWPHVVEGSRELSGVFFIRTLTPCTGVLPSLPEQLSKLHPLRPSPGQGQVGGVRVSHRNGGGHKQADHGRVKQASPATAGATSPCWWPEAAFVTLLRDTRRCADPPASTEDPPSAGR